MSVPGRDQSSQLFSCKWAWCRSTFSNNAGLNYHVVHDHVQRAIPVRRRDISMIRRAEEGKGESLKISELMYSYSSGESILHKSVAEPSSSLPSPPASSPALHSPYHLGRSPGHAPSLSPLPLEKRKKHILVKQSSHDDVSRPTSPHLTSPKPLWGENPPINQIPTFAFLASPEPERQPFSFEMPESPSFSSLVQRSNKCKMASNIANSNQTYSNQPQPLSQSHPLSALFDSQNSVEVPPTQAEEEDDIDRDENLGCGEELRWELLQPPEGYLASDPVLQESQSNDHHHFPFHFHDRPRGSTSKAPHTLLDTSAAMPLSPLSPIPSPTFAVSTPVRQNWYQPPLKRRKRSTCNDKSSDPSPLKVEASFSQTKSKKKFRSGTLSEEPLDNHAIIGALPMDIDSDANRQNNLATSHSPYDLEMFSQSSQDLSDLSETNSYPALQTQAPYQSQGLTQF